MKKYLASMLLLVTTGCFSNTFYFEGPKNQPFQAAIATDKLPSTLAQMNVKKLEVDLVRHTKRFADVVESQDSLKTFNYSA